MKNLTFKIKNKVYDQAWNLIDTMALERVRWKIVSNVSPVNFTWKRVEDYIMEITK